jgi:exonuclease SbcD
MITGDLFEQDYITLSDLKDVRNQFATMTDVEIFICAGNHDPIINERSGYNLLKWSPNVHIFGTDIEKITIEKYNLDIYGFSWCTKELKSYDFSQLAVEDSSKFNILMLHGDAYTSSVYLPLDMTELFGKGFDYIALGHIHKPDDEQYRWAYPGTPEPLDFSETGSHGIIEGIVGEEGLKIQLKPFAKRSFIHKSYDINEEMSFEEIRSMIRQDIENDLRPDDMYRIKLTGIRDVDVDLNTDMIKESLEELVFYAEVYDETFENYDLERIKSENAGNIIETFIDNMEAKGLEDLQNKDALYEGLHLLLKEQVN